MSRVSGVPDTSPSVMMSSRPSRQRSKSWAAGLHRSPNASWVMRISVAPRVSASVRISFSLLLMKGETSTPSLAAV